MPNHLTAYNSPHPNPRSHHSSQIHSNQAIHWQTPPMQDKKKGVLVILESKRSKGRTSRTPAFPLPASLEAVSSARSLFSLNSYSARRLSPSNYKSSSSRSISSSFFCTSCTAPPSFGLMFPPSGPVEAATKPIGARA